MAGLGSGAGGMFWGAGSGSLLGGGRSLKSGNGVASPVGGWALDCRAVASLTNRSWICACSASLPAPNWPKGFLP